MTDQRDVMIHCAMRKSSQRVPNKMLRPFAGTSLAEIAVSKLAALQCKSWRVCLASRGEEFEALAAKYFIPYVERSQESVDNETTSRIIAGYVSQFSQPWQLEFNGCLALLRVETIEQFAIEAMAAQKPRFGLIQDRDYFLNEDRQPLNWQLDQFLNTKTVKPVFRFAHALYYYSRQYLLERGEYWDWRELEYSVFTDYKELFDIDWLWQFDVAEQLFLKAKGA